MSRFAPGDRVEWVSRLSGIRREGEVVEELPGKQWAVRPDGCTVEQAVDADELVRCGNVTEPAPPSLRVLPGKTGRDTKPSARPQHAGDFGRLGGLASARRRQELTAKREHAVKSGRRGGLKGGPARAAALSPARRSAIAQEGAEARWKKAPPPCGSYARYRRGCRCSGCMAANARQQREFQARRRARTAYFDVRATRRSPWGQVEQVQVGRLDSRRMGWRDVWEVLALHRPGCWALQVFPDADHLIDEVDCYHLWVLPAGVIPEPLTINEPAEATA